MLYRVKSISLAFSSAEARFPMSAYCYILAYWAASLFSM